MFDYDDGMRYDSFIIQAIKKMRRSGLSLTELAKKFAISKTTIWYHVKDIDIGLRGMGSIRKSMMDWDAAKKASNALIGKLGKIEKNLVVAALYWGEGSKKDFSISNTDPQLIKTFISCLGALGIQKDALRVSIRIYEDIDRHEALNFWSNVTGVAVDKFLNSIKNLVVEKLSSPRSSKDRAPHS